MNDTATQEPVVTLTPSAAEYVKGLLAKEDEPAGKALRIFVEGGGCSGFQYGMTFDAPKDDDVSMEFHGVRVLVDPFSADRLRGATVDFVNGLNGAGFKITNPNAKSGCGCGKSFC
jgi:iron-sulfur cluster assembly accessory protein